jgi:hypothetical protein
MHCATSRTVSGSIPSGVTLGVFSVGTDRTMCPEVDSASKNEYQGFILGVKATGAWGWRPTTLVKKSGALTYPEPPWAISVCCGRDLYLTHTYLHRNRKIFGEITDIFSSTSLTVLAFRQLMLKKTHHLLISFSRYVLYQITSKVSERLGNNKTSFAPLTMTCTASIFMKRTHVQWHYVKTFCVGQEIWKVRREITWALKWSPWAHSNKK